MDWTRKGERRVDPDRPRPLADAVLRLIWREQRISRADIARQADAVPLDGLGDRERDPADRAWWPRSARASPGAGAVPSCSSSRTTPASFSVSRWGRRTSASP